MNCRVWEYTWKTKKDKRKKQNCVFAYGVVPLENSQFLFHMMFQIFQPLILQLCLQLIIADLCICYVDVRLNEWFVAYGVMKYGLFWLQLRMYEIKLWERKVDVMQPRIGSCKCQFSNLYQLNIEGFRDISVPSNLLC